MRRSVSASATLVTALAWACVLDVYPARAQVTGGSIGGVVIDQQGAALPGARLTASAPPIGKSVTTAADGSYRLVDLAPGTYTVTSELRGFANSRCHSEGRRNE